MLVPSAFALLGLCSHLLCRAAGPSESYDWQLHQQQDEEEGFWDHSGEGGFRYTQDYGGSNPYGGGEVGPGGYMYGWNQNVMQQQQQQQYEYNLQGGYPNPYALPPSMLYDTSSTAESPTTGSHEPVAFPASPNTTTRRRRQSDHSPGSSSSSSSLYRSDGVAIESTPRLRRPSRGRMAGTGSSGSASHPHRPPVPPLSRQHLPPPPVSESTESLNPALVAAIADFRRLNLYNKPINYKLPPEMEETSARGEGSSSSSAPLEDKTLETEGSMDLGAVTNRFELLWRQRRLQGEARPKEMAINIAQLTIDTGHTDTILALALSKVQEIYDAESVDKYLKYVRNCMAAIRYFSEKQEQSVGDARVALNLYAELRNRSRARREAS